MTHLIRPVGITVKTESHDICEITTCPIKPGPVSTKYTEATPSIEPKGTYTVVAKTVDPSGTEASCTTFKYKVGSAAVAIFEIGAN